MPSSYEPDIAPGQSVWCYEKGNGIITHIDFPYQIVYCDFYDKGDKQFEVSDFPSNWDDKLSQWVLVPL